MTAINFAQTTWNNFKQISTDKKFILLLLLFTFFNNLLWISVIPYNRGPDEYLHLQTVKFIFNNYRLPVYGVDLKPFLLHDPTIIVSPYASMPGLNYILVASLGWLSKLFISNISLLYIGRIVSTLFHLITVFLGYKIASKLFTNNNFMKFMIPSLIALTPQMTFVSAYLNIDAFSMMTSTLLIYSLILAKEKNFDTKSALMVGLAIGLVTFSKYNAYILIILSFIFLGIGLRKQRQQLVKYFAIILVLIFVTSGWWFIRNTIIYKGDILGTRIQQQEFQKLSHKSITEGTKVNNVIPYYIKERGDLFDLLSKTNWLERTFKSTWGYFGYMNMPLEESHYQLLWILNALAFAGIVIAFQKDNLPYKNTLIMLAIAASSIFLLSLLLSYYSDFQAQGRYLFPLIVAFFTLFSYGLYTVFQKDLLRKSMLVLIVGFFLFLNLTALLNYIMPTYLFNLDLAASTPLAKQPKMIINNGQIISQTFKPVGINLNSLNLYMKMDTTAFEERRRNLIRKIIKNGHDERQEWIYKQKLEGLDKTWLYKKRQSLAMLKLALKDEQTGRTIRRKTLYSKISNIERSVPWTFRQINDSKNKIFRLTAQSVSAEPFTIMLAGKKYDEGAFFSNEIATNDDLLFNLFYATSKKRMSLETLWKKYPRKFVLFGLVIILSVTILALATFASFFKKEYI